MTDCHWSCTETYQEVSYRYFWSCLYVHLYGVPTAVELKQRSSTGQTLTYTCFFVLYQCSQCVLILNTTLWLVVPGAVKYDCFDSKRQQQSLKCKLREMFVLKMFTLARQVPSTCICDTLCHAHAGKATCDEPNGHDSNSSAQHGDKCPCLNALTYFPVCESVYADQPISATFLF